MKTALAVLLGTIALFNVAPAGALGLGLGGTASGSAGVGSGNAGLSLDLSAGASTSETSGGTVGLTATASGSGTAGGTASGQIDAVINLIESSDWTGASLNGVAVTSAQITDVNGLLNSSNQTAFDAAIAANAADIHELQVAVAANASLSAVLNANDIDASSVVALELNADGTVDVFSD